MLQKMWLINKDFIKETENTQHKWGEYQKKKKKIYIQTMSFPMVKKETDAKLNIKMLKNSPPYIDFQKVTGFVKKSEKKKNNALTL